MALVYVDDMLLSRNDLDVIASTKASLHKAFTIKDLGLARYFLGLEIDRTEAGIRLNQRKYVLDLLRDGCMLDCKSSSFPMHRN